MVHTACAQIPGTQNPSIPFICTALLRSLSLLNKDADALIMAHCPGLSGWPHHAATAAHPHGVSRQQRLLSRRLNNAKTL
ncbi:MAG: hypothetical protein IPI14_12690 [Polaromonas sp.]|nr:hypothetical protein [Polaromonas sp.]